jgi:predicted dienelactone hydrolase
MRLFEWLFCLSFVPMLVLPFISQWWRQRGLLIATLLPVLAMMLHLAIESWRTQMIPLYIVSALVVVGRMRTILNRTNAGPHKRDRFFSAAIALALVLGGTFAGWILPVITLPEPTGPYQVGIVDRELIDHARGRRLMVSVWYPAASGGAPAPLTHYPNQIMMGLANLTGLPTALFQHLRYIHLAASEGVSVQASSISFPVLVFSHGMVGLRLQNSSTFQELASWGYIVVAIDHTDAAAVTVFPDGETRFYNLERFGVPSGAEPDAAFITERVFPVWVADQRFIYDTVEVWQRTDPLLAGRLDLTRIGSFGHSFGGATALEVCRIDARCRAAVDMDGGLYGDSVTLPAVRPLLLMSSADSNRYPSAIAKWTQLIANARTDAYWFELPHSTHLSFTFGQLLSPLLAPPSFDPRSGLHIVDKYLRGFFDRYLRDMPTQLLGPTSRNTDVRWRTK